MTLAAPPAVVSDVDLFSDDALRDPYPLYRELRDAGPANRDERHFPDPDRFDVHRGALDHLAFSYGTHACAGQGLARLEAHAVFSALAKRVTRIELTGEPARAVNNITRGFARVPVAIR